MFQALLAPKFLLLFGWVASAAFVHFRGRVRHRFARQLTDHSTFLAPINAIVYLFSAVPRKAILDTKDFPEVAPLRENWEMIRDEAKQLFESGHISPAEKYNDIAFNTFFKRGWKRFYIKWYGEPFPSARELCPKTVELMEANPAINAGMFALMPPGSKLGAHRDPFAGALRYHLGLMTPNDDRCRIYIDGEAYSWRNGEDIVFDETYIHAANNDTDEYRIIFFCDIARPVRTRPMQAFVRFMSRHVLNRTASQNVEGEKVGFVNYVSGFVYSLNRLFTYLKHNTNRTLYYAVKYALVLLVIYLFIRI